LQNKILVQGDPFAELKASKPALHILKHYKQFKKCRKVFI